MLHLHYLAHSYCQSNCHPVVGSARYHQVSLHSRSDLHINIHTLVTRLDLVIRSRIVSGAAQRR